LSFEWVDARQSLARIVLKWRGRPTNIGLNDENAPARLVEEVINDE